MPHCLQKANCHSMVLIHWIIFNFLPIFGFFLALTLMVHQNRVQRSPSSTVAWLLAILLVPYIGVPAYMLFGGRKIRRMTKNKPSFSNEVSRVFPLRGGNEISLLVTGEKAYTTLIDLIDHAEKSIDIATFVLGNDETGAAIIAALVRRAKQGVRVRLLLDALGSFHVSKKKLLTPLVASGGRYAFFMPMMPLPFRGRANLRNHRKIVIIDNTTALVGGMNLAREYMGTNTDLPRWHDLSLVVNGPVLADLQAVFSSDWQFAARQKTANNDVPVLAADGATIALQLVPSGPDVVGDPLYDSIITAIFKAQQRVWIVTPYFIPDEMLLMTLCLAARRGIDVRIVLPSVSNHPLADLVRQSYLRQIQDNGATIYTFTPGMLHGKVILVDTTLGVVGSMNMDIRSLFLNYEIALFIYNQRVVKELENWITNLMKQSDRGIKKTNIVVEFLEGVGRLLSPLL